METLIKKKAETLFSPKIGAEICVSKIDLPFLESPYCRHVEDGFVLETYLSTTFHLPEFSYVIMLYFGRDINAFDLKLMKKIVVERIKSGMRVKSFGVRYIVVSVSRKDNYLVSNINQEIRRGI